MHVSFTGAGRDALDHALSRAPEHWKPPLRIVRDFDRGLMMVAQGREAFEVPTDRPHLVIIGDDLHAALGPGGFHAKALRRFLPRCAVAVIVAAEPLVDAYTFAAAAPVALGQDAVLIETRAEREGEWARLLDELCPTAARSHVTTMPVIGRG